MAYQTGIISTRARVYNMTGITNYTPSNGTDLGRVSDLILAKLERDVTTYRGLRTGTTPTMASIDGEGCMIEFSLWEYDSATIAVMGQRIVPAANANNLHGFGNVNYKLGKLLGSSELLSLMIADEETPGDYPKLYIHKAVVTDVSNLHFTRGQQGSLTSPAVIKVIALHSDTLGAPFVFGNSANFPALT